MAQDRSERLKVALRENLKRRKAQERGRACGERAKAGGEGAAEPDPAPEPEPEPGGPRD